MPEVCTDWKWLSEHADQAMANSLRRSNVGYRGKAQDRYSLDPVPLKHVVAGLLKVDPLYSTADYEQAEVTRGIQINRFPAPLFQRTEKRTAKLIGAELTWEPFRDNLILFELPRDATPNPDPVETSQFHARPERLRRPKKPKSRGPKPGIIRRYAEDDRKLFPAMEQRMREEKLSYREAAARLADEGKVDGRGTKNSSARRLADLYKLERMHQQN
jgi:hypothetical protein